MGGQAAAITSCSQNLGKIYHFSNFSIVRHLVQASVEFIVHFQNFSVILLKIRMQRTVVKMNV